MPALTANHCFALRWRAVGCGVIMGGILVSILAGCYRAQAVKPRSVAAAVAQPSGSCRECHPEIYSAWSGSDHALANHPVRSGEDAAILATFSPPPGVGFTNKPDMILGHKPLWQPLIPAPGGRWQPHEIAYDPAKHEWFNVFGTENRQPGEWGHWTGRGMNWNSMCAQCHMTGYQKNYDAATDRYRSSWVEHGIGCIQCHGPFDSRHGASGAPAAARPPPFFGDRQKMMQTCAPCHARSEQLTLDFQPGDNFHDHYRVVLPVDQAVYYPDGQQRDEDFNWTSVLLSRMAHAGVTCLDCHDPHTTKTLLPVSNNQLCMQCHVAPGRVQPNGTRAKPIDPVAHSHHQDGSTGNSCVACHMPTTNYMQRAPRHDHGWLRPDPRLTKELGIPNACSRCHADHPLEWSIEAAEKWYGPDLAARQRARARAGTAAQEGAPGADAALLALLQDEDIPAWRATYLSLLVPYAGNPAVMTAARASLTGQDPLERAAAVRLFNGSPEAGEAIKPLLADPIRLVRLDAVWVLSAQLPADAPARKEFDAYLDVSADQPTGRLRRAQDLANRGRMAEAEKEVLQAIAWDHYSPVYYDVYGLVLAGLGRTQEAAAQFYHAAELAPNGAPMAMRAGLAYAEAGQMTEAENALRLAVTKDPHFDRGWYNLGLLQAQLNRLAEAAESLRQAEAAAPAVADYPFALATVLIRLGDRHGARDAARRTLQLNPNHGGALEVLRALR